MRIAAGVLLILLSVLHGCLGAGLTILGGASTVVGDAAQNQALDGTLTMTDDRGEAVTVAYDRAEVRAAGAELAKAGSLLVVYGVYLLLLFGLEIAAAVLLFIRKSPLFVVVVGAMGFVPLMLGLVAGQGFSVWVAIGLVPSALAIVAALAMKKEFTGGPLAPAPA
jgi:hypothetical protein